MRLTGLSRRERLHLCDRAVVIGVIGDDPLDAELRENARYRTAESTYCLMPAAGVLVPTAVPPQVARRC